MNYSYACVVLIIAGSSFTMEKPLRPSHPASGSKSQMIRPTRLKGSVITTPIPRTQSSKEVSDSINQRVGSNLIAAIQDGDYEEVKKLLMTRNAAANFMSPTNETPLFVALTAPNYNHKILIRLLAYYADPNKSVSNKTPFELAIEKNNQRAALQLIYAGAMVQEHKKRELLQSELFYQLSRPQEKINIARIQHVLRCFDSVNFHPTSDLNNLGNQDTPLLCTIQEPNKFNAAVFQAVLKKSIASRNARNGLSPLYKAVLFDNEPAAVRLLMEEANYEYVMQYGKEKPLSIRELAQQMNMAQVVQTIDQLIAQKEAAQGVNKDVLVATLEKQTTPRLTKSPREAAPKP